MSYQSLTALRLVSDSASSGLSGIVDDDDVGAAPGQDAADRCRHAYALIGRHEIGDCLLARQPGVE